MRPEYRLAASFAPGEAQAAAAAGFRVLEMLAWGRIVYVDDLVTRAAMRGRGHADAVMAFVEAEAARGWSASGCSSTPACSPSGPTRTASTSATACGSTPFTSHRS